MDKFTLHSNNFLYNSAGRSSGRYTALERPPSLAEPVPSLPVAVKLPC